VRAIVKSRGILAGLALVATAGMTACSANGTPTNSGQGNVQTTNPAATTSAAAAQTAAAPSATPSSTGGIQNLVISAAEKSQLTAAFVALKGISLSDVAGAGPTQGSVYYAYDPATDTYWALAQFATSSTASFNVQVNFQDGGSIGMFRKAGAGAWQVQLGSVPEWCGEAQFFPLPVLAAWSMPTTKPAGLGC
jgi:hypothetical protein